MFGLGFQEILLLALVALLLFGAAKLPDVGRALGKTIREFKKAMGGEDSENREAKSEKRKNFSETKQAAAKEKQANGKRTKG